MTPSKILFYFCVSFIIGISIDLVTKISQYFLLGFLLAAVFAILVFIVLKKDNFVLIGFCMLFLLMGILRMQIAYFGVANDGLSKLNGRGQVVLTGFVADDPDIRETSQKIKVQSGSSTVLVTTDKYSEYKYLDTIKVTGKLESPMVSDDFNYKNYLLPQHIYSVMSFPKIETLPKKQKYNIFACIYGKILYLKQALRQSIENNFSPPQSSILRGTILGDTSAISQDLKNKLNTTGLRHFIAISGLHIVILISIIMSFLLACGMWRSKAFYFAAIFICTYIILTGASAAAVRAGIMGITYLLAQKLGRQAVSFRVLVLTAALMLLINPLLLFYDVGFQLSFLDVLGLIYFEPLARSFIKFLLKKFLNININEKWESALMMVSVTIAAQIFTLPITIFNFGSVSWVSPIANILVLPVFYYLMLFGFLSALAGIVWSALGWILSIPCYFLTSYFIWVTNFFSQPQMAKSITGVSWIWVLASYLFIGTLTWFLRKKFSHKFV